MKNYTVVVGNIGTVRETSDRADAMATWKAYVERSRQGIGRGGHEPVTLFEDGEIIREHVPEGDET